MTTLYFADQTDLCDPDNGIEAFDPFAYERCAGDRRDIAECEHATEGLAWVPLALVQQAIKEGPTATWLRGRCAFAYRRADGTSPYMGGSGY